MSKTVNLNGNAVELAKVKPFPVMISCWCIIKTAR